MTMNVPTRWTNKITLEKSLSLEVPLNAFRCFTYKFICFFLFAKM